jgi:hypothetical protein
MPVHGTYPRIRCRHAREGARAQCSDHSRLPTSVPMRHRPRAFWVSGLGCGEFPQPRYEARGRGSAGGWWRGSTTMAIPRSNKCDITLGGDAPRLSYLFVCSAVFARDVQTCARDGTISGIITRSNSFPVIRASHPCRSGWLLPVQRVIGPRPRPRPRRVCGILRRGREAWTNAGRPIDHHARRPVRLAHPEAVTAPGSV